MKYPTDVAMNVFGSDSFWTKGPSGHRTVYKPDLYGNTATVQRV